MLKSFSFCRAAKCTVEQWAFLKDGRLRVEKTLDEPTMHLMANFKANDKTSFVVIKAGGTTMCASSQQTLTCRCWRIRSINTPFHFAAEDPNNINLVREVFGNNFFRDDGVLVIGTGMAIQNSHRRGLALPVRILQVQVEGGWIVTDKVRLVFTQTIAKAKAKSGAFGCIGTGDSPYQTYAVTISKICAVLLLVQVRDSSLRSWVERDKDTRNINRSDVGIDI